MIFLSAPSDSQKQKPFLKLTKGEALAMTAFLLCFLWALYASFSVNLTIHKALREAYQRMAFSETVYHAGKANDVEEILFFPDSALDEELSRLLASYCYRRIVFLGPDPQLPYKNYTVAKDWGRNGDLRISISEYGLSYIDGKPYKTFPAWKGVALFQKLEAFFTEYQSGQSHSLIRESVAEQRRSK